MQEVQLYIKDGTYNKRLDLFKDETISLTQTIQNVRDIDKIFTSFSKSFSVPASKVNNKIFKHYYNFDITDGYDARVKRDAFIELNTIPFKSGKIKLEGVEMKDNKPFAYKITFFGDIVDLKDKLGEKKLSDINLSTYNIDYDAETVEQKLRTNPSISHIIAPLITHTQRLFYDSSNEEPDDGNLHWQSGGGNHIHGVKWNQLKYAIRVNKILEEISSQFDLDFSTDFFNNTSVDKMDNLFMWLHRKSGFVEDLSGETNTFETPIDGWTPDVTQSQDFKMIFDDTLLVNTDTDFVTEFEISFYTTTTADYSVEIFKDGTSVYTATQSGGGNHIADAVAGDFDVENGTYMVFVTADQAITFTNIEWRCEVSYPYEPPEDAEFDTSTFTTSSAFLFNVDKQIPDMRILDFLTGLFKMFNLTAEVIDGVIVVKELNDFYANPTIRDITEYVTPEKHNVDVALPYREIIFRFKDTQTFLANKYGELYNKPWGELRYNANRNDLAGSLYSVEAPFGHMLFERLSDQDTGTTKNIQYGWSVDKSQNAYLGAPLMFYPIRINTGGISFVDQLNDDGVASSHKVIYSINLPFNSVSNSSTTDPFQLNFAREQSEWTADTTFSETLFDEYRDYIVDVFNTKQRLTIVEAVLPVSFLTQYSLSDEIIVKDKKYKINSIQTDLQTGKSTLELLNVYD